MIQPHLPVLLPCYDFTPVIDPTLGGCLLAVSAPTLGITNSHGVTGGVYKARERIQGVVADTPLLAIPASWSRVADIQSELRPIFEIRIASRRSIPLCRPL